MWVCGVMWCDRFMTKVNVASKKESAQMVITGHVGKETFQAFCKHPQQAVI
jgi:hypothetical protein